ncbi:hypothetical protein Plec18167_001827 [Paecilomyces lecythidis]|uniref:VOC domain-containing protein n=1 Tax=Paecilomyces lecythidis TaxID=3004212 RepID=A0ABR3YAZ6_9EURO
MAAENRVQLLKTAFVVYYHADLERAKTFLLDFGLTIALENQGKEIYFQGYGTEPYVYVARQSEGQSFFGGAAYVVDSREQLEKAHKYLGGTIPRSLDGPGGGEVVSLTDPLGNYVHLIWGWQEKQRQSIELEKLDVNYEDEKPRKGRFHRFKPGPAPIHRWGHYGVTYTEGAYEKMYTWYTTTLSLAPSDFVYRDGKPITCFFHIDRGLEYSDHHAFFFKPAKPGQNTSVAHAAFEVHDFDIQQLGHNYLESKGYKICWGVGRHVLGSQVFDYWFDPSGFVVEHYADGDLVNIETPISHVPAGPQALSIWGPPVPPVF